MNQWLILLIFLVILVFSYGVLFVNTGFDAVGMFGLNNDSPKYKIATMNYLSTPHLANPDNVYKVEPKKLIITQKDTN
jgi:hypothetical protein